jgi:hypothetical protein
MSITTRSIFAAQDAQCRCIFRTMCGADAAPTSSSSKAATRGAATAAWPFLAAPRTAAVVDFRQLRKGMIIMSLIRVILLPCGAYSPTRVCCRSLA